MAKAGEFKNKITKANLKKYEKPIAKKIKVWYNPINYG